ncbi:phage tail domain-containing protein [Paenibacillus pabuli]|uniref:phage tail domain-containing protein n=1 Tax=Paenibacillus pabuli TaxID=1472 RepID=UPI001FFF99B1|nr:phage tail domain-containing protein [Paenibacillus pabuli]UPK45772.1 phage tail family protein [Paenibacillus pabuli]
MSNEMIWLGGKSNIELGFLVRGTSRRPGLPDTVDRTLNIPGRNGQYNYGADIGARTFVYDCAMITKDYMALQQAVMGLASHLVDSYGKPRKLELRQRERPNQAFAVQLTGSFDPERIMGLGMFSLSLIAHDPFAYGLEQIEEVLITTSPYKQQVVSKGNVRTAPLIVITNQGNKALSRLRITNEYLLEG